MSANPFMDMLHDMARQEDARDALRIDRDRAECDPNYFAEQVLNFKQFPIHKMIQEHLSAHDRVVIHAPIYFGKSTQVSVIRPIYELCRNPDAKILIASASCERKLKPLFGSLKSLILINKKIQTLWPHMKPEDRPGRESMWTKTAMIVQRTDRWFDETVKQEGFDPADPSIQVGPTEGEFQGARFDFGIGDDMLPSDTATSGAVRDNIYHWFWQSFASRAGLDAKIWLIGTPHHKRDPYHRAIDDHGYVPLLHNGKNLDGEDYEYLWPARKKHVEEKKPGRTHPTTGKMLGWPYLYYMRCIRCQPISDATQYFTLDILEGNYDDDAPYGLENFRERKLTHLPNICGVDLAAGKRKTRGKKTDTSFTCMVPWEGGRFTVPYIKCGTMDTPTKVLTAAHILRTFPNTVFVVEDNGMQEVFADLLRSAAYIADLGIEESLANALAARVQTFTTTINKQDPVSGVQGMDATFRGKRFVLRRNVPEIERWFAGLERYSGEDHTDDPVMSGWFAWRWWTTHTPADYDPSQMLGIELGGTGDIGYGVESDWASEFEPESADDFLKELSIV